MPSKRLTPPSDSSSDISEVPLKRTQRTHEENQERAYIAASRRADRDIEHRIRSALKASECRKKRTGRGLKITREAVLGDEQYESDDDDDTARRFRTAAATSSLSQSFPANRSDRYAEVDALFSKYFPHVQLSSRWAAAPPQRPLSHHQFQPQQPPLQIQTTFPGPYHHLPQHQPGAPDATPVSTTTTQPSPLLTPPVSYPLPPSHTEGGKFRSMSPLALEGSGSGSPAGSRPATATPTITNAAAPHGLGLGLIDPSAAAGSYLLDQDPHAGGYHHPPQPHFFHDAMTGGRTVSVPFVQALYDDPAAAAMTATDQSGAATTAGGGDDPAWFSETSTGAPPHHHGTGWHMRSLSLPSSLEAFHFPFADLTEEEGGGAAGAEDLPVAAAPEAELDSASAMAAAVVDPSILAAAAAVTGDMAAVATGTATPPGEPWADWIDLDGDVPPAVGVKV